MSFDICLNESFNFHVFNSLNDLLVRSGFYNHLKNRKMNHKNSRYPLELKLAVGTPSSPTTSTDPSCRIGSPEHEGTEAVNEEVRVVERSPGTRCRGS